MPKYNIYRIIKSKEGKLIDKLQKSGLSMVQDKEINGSKFRFFFSQNPDTVDIWWVKLYSEFIKESPKPVNHLYFAVLLISDPVKCYAISLGKSHFYLKPFCDPDFGLNMAERIVDEKHLNIKNSKHHKSKRNKTITSYREGSEFEYDAGESWHYLRARTVDDKTWGEKASFGNSVQFCLDMPPSELPALLEKIESSLAIQPIIELPKTTIIDDPEEIKRLDAKLAEAIVKIGNSPQIQIDELAISGVEFIFPENNLYSLFMKYHKKDKTEKGELTIDKLVAFVRNNQIDLDSQLNNILVHIYNEHGRDRTAELKSFLDYVDDERHCLIDGKWHKFNESYLKYLNSEVDKINIKTFENYDSKDDPEEDLFNRARENDGFIRLDKVLDTIDRKYRLEKLDLLKDDTIFFVKRGILQKISYVVDQSLITVKMLQNNEISLDSIGAKAEKIKYICLWFLLNRKSKITKLSQMKSIILTMKLAEWKKAVRDAGYEPIIWINYTNQK